MGEARQTAERAFSLLYVRSKGVVGEDRNSRAVIRDEALRLFAEEGPESVTVRRIAGAAAVSPGLVLHHFGSKDGLREAVDEHVREVFEQLVGTLALAGEAGTAEPASLAAAVHRHLPPDSPLPGYLRRLLLSDGVAARRLFRRLFEASTASLGAMAAAGTAVSGEEPAVRAAFLLVNDLAVLLLRGPLTEVLGTDPLAPDGMARWTSEAMAVYRSGLTAAPRSHSRGGPA